MIESTQVRILSGTILEALYQIGGWIEKLQKERSTITSLKIEAFAESHSGLIDNWTVELQFHTPEDTEG